MQKMLEFKGPLAVESLNEFFEKQKGNSKIAFKQAPIVITSSSGTVERILLLVNIME